MPFFSHIDCAPVYLNEKAIGKVLKEWIDSSKVKREDLFITTKLPDYGEPMSMPFYCHYRNKIKAELSLF